MSSDGLKKLNVWVLAKDLALEVYKTVIPALPVEEKWGLALQIRRSASSIPANIAEGYGRFYYQSNVQFCYNARGSLEETISHVLLAGELGYLNKEAAESIIRKADSLTKRLNGYIAYLKQSKNGKNEPGFPSSVGEEKGQYFSDGLTSTDLPDFDHSLFSIL